MKAYFEKNNADTRKIIWIPNGIEMSKFFHVKNYNEKSRIIKELEISKIIKVDDFVIVYIGHMVFQQKVKGMIDFLYGLNLFLGTLNEREKKKVKLLYLGEGLYSNLLELEIRKLRLDGNVFLLGEKKKVENFYAISDISALTSHIEGFPTVVLESIVSGVPCIATDVGEARQLLDENLLVPVGNREKIAKLLKRLFINKNLREVLVKNSLELVKRFDWKNIAKIIKNVYLNVKNEKAFTRNE
jgi:glycosyltransferase involved in cell wall biosynthesis